MSKLTLERLEEILEADVPYKSHEGCRILDGLNLIAKYLPKSGIGAAEHDQIWACSTDELIEAGLTEEDAFTLRDLGWFIDCESLSKFA